MNTTALGIVIARGIGLFFTVAGFAALLPDLLFIRLFEPVSFLHQMDEHWSSFTLLWQSGMGHEMLSKLLNLIFGVLLLVFGCPVGKWLAIALPNNAA